MDTCFGCEFHYYDEYMDESRCMCNGINKFIEPLDLADSPEWCPLQIVKEEEK